MFAALGRKLFGSTNDRTVKRMRKTVEAINGLEPEFEALSDDALLAKTVEFRTRLDGGEALDDLIPEAFAAVREAAKRTLGQRHYDVQLIGGMVLHQGKIAEMKTGEGKTLVATLAVYLNALPAKGVHVVTVNDYLAQRDAGWMGLVYAKLGLTTGVVIAGMGEADRRAAYHADVTYGTNNEFGFDYLRDNLRFTMPEMVQREHHFAIVDEVDSILVDEARTPLIISGPAQDSSALYRAVNAQMKHLREEDYEKDEKQRSVTWSEEGSEHVETLFREAGLIETGGLYDIQNMQVLHHAIAALRAHTLYRRDTDYIVKDNRVIIIDEFTGRMMDGRRFGEGLHQAIEAKEGVEIQRENQTLASVTYQNYFRLYGKLAGMTGTAMTEASEFAEIYGLEVVDIPTHRPVQRLDHNDEVYRTATEKYGAMITQIQTCHEANQPVLVGTVSIEKSEMVAAALKKRKVPHKVLNARHHEQEAQIVALAGEPGAVTIATNMAGRGTDIQLGGNVDMRVKAELGTLPDGPDRAAKEQAIRDDIAAKKEKVLAAGGLFIIGTERHESRRIDNQLRGRSGRQGDPGASRFYLSLEDDLMRIFGSDRLGSMLQRLGLRDGEAIEHPWINKALETAQKKVEAHNFDIRKNLLKYDNVTNDQRKVIFEQRREIMGSDDLHGTVVSMREEVVAALMARTVPEGTYADHWDLDGLKTDCQKLLGVNLPIHDWAAEEGIGPTELAERVDKAATEHVAKKYAEYGEPIMRQIERNVLLQILDQTWKEHLLMLDQLRQGINLRAYGQRDPLNEYKREAFNLFEAMLDRLRETVTTIVSQVEVRRQAATPEQFQVRRTAPPGQETRTDPADPNAAPAPAPASTGTPVVGAAEGPITAEEADRRAALPADALPIGWRKTPRNALCPCGSGRKFKHCHGKLV